MFIGELVTHDIQALVDAANATAKTLITPVYNVRGYGAKGDGATDDAEAIDSAFDAAEDGSIVYFPAGTYVLSTATTLEYAKSLSVLFAPGAVIDATGSTVDAASPIIKFTGSVGTYYLLGGAITAGDRTLTVDEDLADTLSEGDLIQVTTDSDKGGSGELWNDSGANYFKGEFCEVLSVSDTTVTVKSEFVDSYTAANTVVARISPVKVILDNFRLAATPANHQVGVRIDYGKDVRIVGGNVTGTAHSCLSLYNCLGATVDGFSASDFYLTGTGTNYGISLATCQDIVIQNCHVTGGRHAVSIGGWEPCRFIEITNNIFDSDGNSTIGAIDAHANTQYITIANNFSRHGLVIAGIDTRILNNTFISNDLGMNYHITYRPDGDDITCNYLEISGNTIIGDESGILIYTDLAANRTIKNLTVANNTCKADVGLTVSQGTADTLTIESLLVTGNQFADTKGVLIAGYGNSDRMAFTDIVISNNIFTCSSMPIQIHRADGTTLTISNNTITTSAETSGTIDAYSNATIQDIIFSDNTVRCTHADGAQYAVTLTASRYIAFTNNLLDNFQNDGGAELVAADILYQGNKQYDCTGNISLTGRCFYQTFGNDNVRTWGTAAPTAGTWKVGDICDNSSPSVGQPKGWRCTVAGTAGTWVSEGNL